jgi:tetratricopeptide (TPR) repeat protein
MTYLKAIVLVLACLISTSTAQANQQEEAKQHYKTALELFEADEFEAALPHFKKAYEVSGKRPVTILGLAQCERSLKMYSEAIKHFEEYLASNPPADKAEVIRSTVRLTHKLLDAQKDKAAAEPLPKITPEPPPPPIQGPGIDTGSEKDSSMFAQPWFWIVTGVVAVGGGVAAAFALSGDFGEADSGSTGVLIRP